MTKFSTHPKKVSKLKVIIIVCVLGFAILAGIKIYQGFQDTRKALDEVLPSTYSLTFEDSSFIAPKYQSKLKVIEVVHSTVRDPITLCTFDSTYRLLIYKIKLIRDMSLKDVINLNSENVDISTGVTYGSINCNIYSFWYKSGLINPVSKIYATMAGNSFKQVLINDTLESFSLNVYNFSVRYFKDDVVDILAKGDEKLFGITAILPMDILFLKRNENVFLMLLTPKTANASIPSDLLYKIVTGN